MTAIEEFARHLARFHPRIRHIDEALLRASAEDPDVALLVDRGTRQWLDVCHELAQALADQGRLAPPWTVDTATDLLWSFMFPETLGRLTDDRGWTADRYGEMLATLMRRTLVAP